MPNCGRNRVADFQKKLVLRANPCHLTTFETIEMIHHVSTATGHIHALSAYRADAFRAEYGANTGDALGILDELVLDDIYALTPAACSARLALEALPGGQFSVADSSSLGHPGAAVHLDCAINLMEPGGTTVEALVLVEVDDEGMIAEVYLLPLVPLQHKLQYTLLHASREGARKSLAQAASTSFIRGTRITLATGAQIRVEDLQPGDRVLTRDAGAQEVRWTGLTTQRAEGSLAPVLIKAGALNNENDLLLGPNHRLFVYQRADEIGVGSAEILVTARDLVNGTTVTLHDGGYADYFQILFDSHHIIYAEGIAAESLLVDPVTENALPGPLQGSLSFGRRGSHGVEVPHRLLDRPDAVTALKRASLR